MIYAFDSKRLRVFVDLVAPTPRHYERFLFVAFRTDQDRPMVAANMLISHIPITGWFIDWHEVGSEHRRQGIGTEFRAGIENYVGVALEGSAGSSDGAKFLASLNPAGGHDIDFQPRRRRS